MLIVGDSMLDRYWDGEVVRISPEAPVPVLHVKREFQRAGGAANVALNLVRLGVPVTLATLMGDDDAGERLTALMAQHGVTLAAVRDPLLQTTQKIRPVCRNHQLLRVDFEQVPPAPSVERLMLRLESLLPEHPWVLLSDYAKGTLAQCDALLDSALRHGCRALVDPKGLDFHRYRGAYVLKPNAAEVAAVVGPWSSEEEFLAKAHALRAEVGVEHLLVTRGELGMTLCSAGRHWMHLPAEVREVYDVSGAGDTVLATLAYCLARGDPIEAAARWANKAAGIVVGQFGTASVSPEELGLDEASPRTTPVH